MKINKQILEAIQRGLNLALDDYENIEDNDSISQKSNIINPKSDKYIKYRIEWDELIRKFDEGEVLLNSKELSHLAFLSKTLGYKYDKNYENYWGENKFFLSDAIDCVCQVDPKADLNWMDVSEIIDMSELFAQGTCVKFDGDISNWNVSNVVNMDRMFQDSQFTGDNGDISNWNVSNVKSMVDIFNNSQFKHFQDIYKKWNIKCNINDLF